MHGNVTQKRINQAQQDRFDGKEPIKEDEATKAERLRIKTNSRKIFWASRKERE